MNFTITVREGLELRLRTEADADAFFKVTDKNRAYLRQRLPWLDKTKTPDDTRTFIQSCASAFEKQEGLDLGMWYEGQWIGSMGFHAWDKTNRNASIGYWLSQEFQGKGIMTDAVRAVIKHGFEQMNLNRVEIRCAVTNAKSRAIPERLGFKNEGTCRQCEWLYDHLEDLVIYSLLADEWKVDTR